MTIYKVNIDNEGTKYWYNQNDKLHNEHGPAIETINGNKEWFINGILHREDGPALVYPKYGKSWVLNGKLHRIDGPAVEQTNGYKEWWLNGKQYTEQEYNKIKNPPIVQMTMEEFVKKHGYIIKIVKG